MGITGKEVAKTAADIVLLDDNFNSIVRAIVWGRNIFDNIQKFLQFQLTVNLVAVLTVFFVSLATRSTPLTSVQLLWVNLIMDTLGALALATETPNEAVLERPPHSRKEYLISREMWKNIIGQSVYQLAWIMTIVFAGDRFLPEFEGQENLKCPDGTTNCPLATYSPYSPHGNGHQYVRSGRAWLPFSNVPDYREEFYSSVGPSRHYTLLFHIFVLMQLFNMINSRKIHGEWNPFQGILKSPYFIVIWISIFALQTLLVYVGGYALNCHLDGLTWQQWLLCLPIALGTFLVKLLLNAIPSTLLPQTGAREVDPLLAPSSVAATLRGRSRHSYANKLTSHSVASFRTKEEFPTVRIQTLQTPV
eukprot:Filipodium_phascolosomae@DN8269_c0_g1_i1.p1